MTRIELVVFDMAGTTVRDDGQVPRAFRAALSAHGVELNDEQVHAIRGASKREAIARLLPRAGAGRSRADGAYATFLEQLSLAFAGTVREVSGAASAFADLRRRGIRVALNTGFERDTARMLLDALGWSAETVDAVACGDEVAHGRPAPDLIRRCMELTGIADPAQVANVGDTVLDLRAGRAAGVRFNIGVLSGAHGRDLLEKEPHTHILGSVAELPPLLSRVDAGA